MNERIRELSKQAWEWAEQQDYKDGLDEFSDILEQKFAELIVKECALQCVHNEDMDLIEKHFGIE